MVLHQRLAIALGALLLLGGALATFLPTSPQGAACGTWVAPEWTDEGVRELAGTSGAVDGLRGSNFDGSLDDELATMDAIAYVAVTSKRLCDDALATRRTTAIVLLVLGVVAPAGVLFVGAARRDDAAEADC